VFGGRSMSVRCKFVLISRLPVSVRHVFLLWPILHLRESSLQPGAVFGAAEFDQGSEEFARNTQFHSGIYQRLRTARSAKRQPLRNATALPANHVAPVSCNGSGEMNEADFVALLATGHRLSARTQHNGSVHLVAKIIPFGTPLN
jgi:hypothetical protein